MFLGDNILTYGPPGVKTDNLTIPHLSSPLTSLFFTYPPFLRSHASVTPNKTGAWRGQIALIGFHILPFGQPLPGFAPA